VRSLSLNALAHFGDAKALADDKALNDTVEPHAARQRRRCQPVGAAGRAVQQAPRALRAMAETSATDDWSEARFRAVVDTVAGTAAADTLLGCSTNAIPPITSAAPRPSRACADMRCSRWPATRASGRKDCPSCSKSSRADAIPTSSPLRPMCCACGHAPPALAPFVVAALSTLFQHDDAVDLSRYGGAAVGADAVPAFDEVLRCLAWLGPAAAAERAALQALVTEPADSRPNSVRPCRTSCRRCPWRRRLARMTSTPRGRRRAARPRSARRRVWTMCFWKTRTRAA
jgi:hypothetical protein